MIFLELNNPDETNSLRLIHKKIIFFFNSLPAEDKLNYSYAFDVRLRKADGEYIRLLCQLDCVELGENGHLLAGKETYKDITSQHNFPNMKLVISRHDKDRFKQDEIYNFRRNLSKKERQIDEYIRQGLVSKEIGEKLNISKNTVDTYRRRIKKK